MSWRRFGLAVGAFAVGLVLFALGYPLDSWVGVATLGASTASLLFLRSYPRLSLGVASAALAVDWMVGPNLVPIFVLANALYELTERGSERTGRRLMIGSIGAVLVFTVIGLARQGDIEGALYGVQVALFTVLPVDTAMTVRRHRQTAAAERERAEQTARLAELDQRAAITAERTRVARDLHDLVANDLSVIALHSTAALARPDDAEAAQEALGVIRQHSVSGLAEMRHLIGVLRADDGGDSPAEARLDQLPTLVESIRADGQDATLRVDGEARRLAPAVELAGYRIVQEALVNARKHAASQPVDTLVRYGPDALTLTVENPLPTEDCPFPLVGGAGLVGMAERATLVGGALDAGPRDGRWRVHAEIPL
ncbi:sensor histidine kinase [Cryptosporangium aurantiacum]|uniref:histidine kinase n=1 Tax=Cryptosporangium aurantiacum TaxID=134849 RepID=A0A1M7QEY0_9ACTN|nr:histidine kinase [Cryptosporangium aurantiacum]SHN29449.1 Signal transduction histidine kinase [Cryptosporangium aurantiacum]